MDLFRHISRLVLPLFLIALFALKGYIVLDPDFGWHLRTGQIIFQEGITTKDHFSFSMPDHEFINHEWLVDVAIALLFPFLGNLGISFLFAVIAALALIIATLGEEKRFAPLPLLLTATSILSYGGIRPQVVSWFFFSVVLVLYRSSSYSKKFALLPVIFLLWANTHAGFALGLGIISLYVITNSVRKKRLALQELVLLITCVLITLINPYGIKLWELVIIHATTPSLSVLGEWAPLYQTSLVLVSWATLAIGSLLVWLQRQHLQLQEKILLPVLLIAAISASRNLPLFLIFLLPLIIRSITLFYARAKKIPYGTKRFTIFFNTLSVVFYVLIAAQLLSLWVSFIAKSEKEYYPQQAVMYLQQQTETKRIFTDLGWGGYVIWKYPKAKVFIDGRMVTWVSKKNGTSKSENAFEEYRSIITRKRPFQPLLQTYSIDTVLLPRKEIEKMQKLEPNGGQGLLPTLDHQLTSSGWKEIYKDPVSLIYRLPQ